MVFNVLLLYYIVLQGDTQFSITMAYNGLECIIIVLLYCRGYTVQYNNDLEFIIIVLQGDIHYTVQYYYGVQ